jgi:hypothetical protein
VDCACGVQHSSKQLHVHAILGQSQLLFITPGWYFGYLRLGNFFVKELKDAVLGPGSAPAD